MKILVFGASGMIGSAMFRTLSDTRNWQVFGTLRSSAARRFFQGANSDRLMECVDVEKPDSLARAFSFVQPDVVVNCIGLTKHHVEAADPLLAIPVNAMLPHRMADLCSISHARLIHISTDCVFSGAKGNYTEQDPVDANDLYGKTKYLGEVAYPHSITLRTSTIGHELNSSYGLLEWFLAQAESCKGFSRAIFSGLPNTVLAQLVRDVVIPRPDLNGLYHIGARPIGKFELLSLIARAYEKTIDIIRDDEFMIDRSLDSSRFCEATGYMAPDWPELIAAMYNARV